MQLYEFPPTRSIRPRWVLQELGVPFESVIVDPRRGDLRSPAFLKLNPAARIPVLVDGELVLNESVAICLYLAEKYPHGGLMPADVGARAEVNRWLWFTVTELEQPLWRITRHTFLYPEAKRLPADMALAREDFAPMAAVVEDHLNGRQFVAGESFTRRRHRARLHARLGRRGEPARRAAARAELHGAHVRAAERRAADRGRVRVDLVDAVAHTSSPFLRITSEKNAALAFGMRAWVAKSVCTMPKRFELPNAHSKLSSSDQT